MLNTHAAGEAREGRASRTQKKRRTHRPVPETAYESVPRSFVLKAGALGASAQTLVRDFRKVMLPYTAAKLKVPVAQTHTHTHTHGSAPTWPLAADAAIHGRARRTGCPPEPRSETTTRCRTC